MKNLLPLLALATIFCATSTAQAEIITQVTPYEHEGVKLAGFLAYDDALTGKRPGVLVVHEWWGRNEYAQQRAVQLAKLGYVAFALDMYGADVVAKSREEAAKLAAPFRGQPIMRTRARAGLDVLLRQPQVDADRVAAIGFCFGGTTCLELAYSGAPLKGVVSFHGGLVNPSQADLERTKASLLVLHGADDPFVPVDQVDSFLATLRKSNLDWQFIIYGGAVHAFTNPAAGSDKSSGAAYQAAAAERSWAHMRLFFEEIFE